MSHKKEYKYPKTKELIKKLKPYWTEVQLILDEFYGQLNILEKKMEKETGIDGIEFFFMDNEIVGIGNAERTMDLIRGYGEFDNE